MTLDKYYDIIYKGNMKTINQIRKEIKPAEWYKPRTIVNNGWIQNAEGDNGTCHYDYILKLIRLGKLPAKDFGLGKKPYYRLSGQMLLDYLRDF